MQKYQIQAQPEEQDVYKQDLGLRKMLYKYEHENNQLRNQIKALTDRLTSILDKSVVNQTQKQKAFSAMEDLNQKFLNQQINIYFKQIQQSNLQIKKYKQLINQSKEGQYIILQNKIKNKDTDLNKLKNKVKQYQQQEEKFKVSSINKIKVSKQQQFHQQALILSNQLQTLKKRIRNLEKERNQKQKKDINTHKKVVDLQYKNRKARQSPSVIPIQQQRIVKKKGLWHKQLTQENYHQLKQQFQQVKKQKNVMIQSIKIQNKGLSQRLNRLKSQYDSLIIQNNSFQMPTIPKKQKVYLDTPNKRNSNTPIMVNKSLNLGPSQYQRKNDKNFVAKKQKKVQWVSTTAQKKGLSWKDQNCKSPITGINLWFDKSLIGIQFVHTMGQSIQHMHLVDKKITPIQYRLSGNDYVQNIILVTTEGIITGIQILSKNKRTDSFGQKVGASGTKKFDFGVKNPQKPIFSYGSFIINKDNVSIINKLGFSVI